MSTIINQDRFPNEFALHKKYAHSDLLLDLVWAHSTIVADITIQLYQHQPSLFDFPIEVAVQGALLHDIGVYLCDGFDWVPDQPEFNRPYSLHTVTGAWILHSEGYLPEIVQAADFHAGVGLTAQDIELHQLDLPTDNYLPTSQFHQLICYAAKFHSKSPTFKTADEVKNTLSRHGEDKIEFFEKLVEYFGEPELEKLTQNYEQWHKSFTFRVSQLTSQPDLHLSSAGVSKLGNKKF